MCSTPRRRSDASHFADGVADQHLVRKRAVHVRRVEERDGQLESTVDGGDRFCFVAPFVELAHPHAAEPERRDAQTLLA
jgi:hypothetical protein